MFRLFRNFFMSLFLLCCACSHAVGIMLRQEITAAEVQCLLSHRDFKESYNKDGFERVDVYSFNGVRYGVYNVIYTDRALLSVELSWERYNTKQLLGSEEGVRAVRANLAKDLKVLRDSRCLREEWLCQEDELKGEPLDGQLCRSLYY
jgi:hypothetical protein